MPVIRTYSAGGGHLAAAVMGAMAVGRPDIEPPKARSKAEKTRKANPNGLTVRQHVFPMKSIGRFVADDGRVAVNDIPARRVWRAKPKADLFCAQRAWDQRAEAGYMKEIEDRFQILAEALIAGQGTVLTPDDKAAIDRFFALWYMRARHHELPEQEIRLNGITGDDLTKEQEENLEAKGYLFARSGGFMPARQLNGLWLQQQIDGYTDTLKQGVSRWGVIRPESGEFIVTDTPLHTIMPITPTLALAADVADGVIRHDNLAEVNRAFVSGSQRYFLARDLGACPL